MPFSTGEKALFGVGIGVVLVGVAYAYAAAKETVTEGAKTLRTAGGLFPDIQDLAKIPSIGGELLFDAAGNVIQAGEGLLQQFGFGLVNTFIPGDLPAPGQPGGSIPPNIPYTGPVIEEHSVEYYIRVGTLREPVVSMHDTIILTVGRAFRGETWDSNDWSNIQSYINSSLPDQDPVLKIYAYTAINQQQSIISQ